MSSCWVNCRHGPEDRPSDPPPLLKPLLECVAALNLRAMDLDLAWFLHMDNTEYDYERAIYKHYVKPLQKCLASNPPKETFVNIVKVLYSFMRFLPVVDASECVDYVLEHFWYRNTRGGSRTIVRFAACLRERYLQQQKEDDTNESARNQLLDSYLTLFKFLVVILEPAHLSGYEVMCKHTLVLCLKEFFWCSVLLNDMKGDERLKLLEEVILNPLRTLAVFHESLISKNVPNTLSGEFLHFVYGEWLEENFFSSVFQENSDVDTIDGAFDDECEDGREKRELERRQDEVLWNWVVAEKYQNACQSLPPHIGKSFSDFLANILVICSEDGGRLQQTSFAESCTVILSHIVCARPHRFFLHRISNTVVDARIPQLLCKMISKNDTKLCADLLVRVCSNSSATLELAGTTVIEWLLGCLRRAASVVEEEELVRCFERLIKIDATYLDEVLGAGYLEILIELCERDKKDAGTKYVDEATLWSGAPITLGRILKHCDTVTRKQGLDLQFSPYYSFFCHRVPQLKEILISIRDDDAMPPKSRTWAREVIRRFLPPSRVEGQ